jgi:hypothetical protein
LLDSPHHTLISIGSPLASLSSELMLARMFRAHPFEPARSLDDRLPFCFIWSPQHSRNLRSRFALPADAIPDERGALRRAVLANQASAFRCRRRVFSVRIKADRWRMFGIIAAQRRRPGQVWVVICGQSGPATYAAATKLNEITTSLPWTAGRDGPVLWAVVEAQIRRIPHARRHGDDREVVRARLHGKPRLWPPERGL